MSTYDLSIRVVEGVTIEGGRKVTRISAEVPGHGYYSAIKSVFEALTYSQAVRALDYELSQTVDDRALVNFWKELNEVCLGDEDLVMVVTRIMAGDQMGNENEEAALESVRRYFSSEPVIEKPPAVKYTVEHHLRIGGQNVWCNLNSGTNNTPRVFDTYSQAEAWMVKHPSEAAMRVVVA
jgi:hypothetical protein